MVPDDLSHIKTLCHPLPKMWGPCGGSVSVQKNFVTIVTRPRPAEKQIPWRRRQRGCLDVGSAAEFSDFDADVAQRWRETGLWLRNGEHSLPDRDAACKVG
jgi:hypothetical protein